MNRVRPFLASLWPNCSKRAAHPARRESGYAFLMAMFLVFSIIIGSQIAVQNLVTAGRRDKETDMIWRGNQYVRAIRLYYRKTGHYPQTLDDLEKGLPDLHFLRLAAYKDPMNTEDGSWRFIYVNGAGQIIGSVKYASLQQMAFLDMNSGKPTVPLLEGAVSASSLASSSSGASSPQASSTSAPASGSTPTDSSQSGSPSATTDTSGGAAGAQASGSNQGVGGAATATTTTNSSSPTASGSASGSASGVPSGLSGLSGLATDSPIAQQKPTGPVDGPVLGGFLTGVGSKVDRSSVKVYKGGKKYNAWEFIWNPLEDQARAVQQGLSGGATSATPGLGLPGASPIGGSPGQGAGSGIGGIGAGGIFGGSQPGNPIGLPSPQPQQQQPQSQQQ